jgi:glucose-1-phosphate cytidylyltransferase
MYCIKTENTRLIRNVARMWLFAVQFHILKTVILCGGQGTRLREETEYRPKPLVDIGGRPILWHIMKRFAFSGHHDFILCLGYRGDMIKDYFLNYEAMNNDFTISLGKKQDIVYHGAHKEQDFNVTLAETGVDSNTGARVKRVQRFMDGKTVMVTYGDGLSDILIDDLLRFHRSHGKLATITAVRPRSRFGILDIADDGKVNQFEEKPVETGWANAGYFVFEPGALDYLSSDDGCIMEREPLENLSRDGELIAYRHEGFFFAMDTYREYLYLNQLWSSGRAPWKTPDA